MSMTLANGKKGRRVKVVEGFAPATGRNSKATNEKGRVVSGFGTSLKFDSLFEKQLDANESEGASDAEDKNGYQDTDLIHQLAAARSKKSTSKSSNVHVKLEESITRLFAEAQEESEKRKAACSQYLTKMLADMEVLVQRDIEPETSEIIAMIGKRSKLGTKLVDEHLGSIETIENELEAAVQQANGHVNAHKDHRKQSRKAAMKEAQHEFKRGVDMQKLALDANAYIRHYRKLIML